MQKAADPMVGGCAVLYADADNFLNGSIPIAATTEFRFCMGKR